MRAIFESTAPKEGEILLLLLPDKEEKKKSSRCCCEELYINPAANAP